MTRLPTGIGTVFRREIATIARTPGYSVLPLGLFAVLGGIVAVGGGGTTGFVPAVVDVLLPAELLVPLVAVVVGYRALLTDTASGEIAVIRTYPVTVTGYVGGILLARLVAVLVIVLIPFGLIGVYIWLTAAPDTGIFATHTGVDSPVLYLRFLALVAGLGAVFLTLSAAISALVSSRQSAIALAVIALVAGTLGGDLAILRGLTSGTAPSEISAQLVRTPNGAFRGLVFEYVIGVSFTPDTSVVAASRAVASMVGWTALGVGVSVITVRYRASVDRTIERLRHRVQRRRQ